MYLFNMLLIMMINIILVLISVAFLTLLERKILGYIQIRKGPNKLFFMGLFQPFSDAIKLFMKENFINIMNMYMKIYLLCPMFNLLLLMLTWLLLPIFSNLYSMNLGMIYLFCILSFNIYFIMMMGWSSNSIYAMIGSIRSIAQTISYEVSMTLIIFSLLVLMESFNIFDLFYYQKNNIFIIMMFPMMLMLLVTMLAELNRIPFDLVEGESELISGFNIEYMSGSFAMIFIAEYGYILFSSYLYCLMFLSGDFMNLMFYIKFMLMNILFIWIRGSFPRYRYDNLMFLTWKFYLFFSLLMLMFFFMFKLLIMI